MKGGGEDGEEGYVRIAVHIWIRKNGVTARKRKKRKKNKK